jgi:hypothetical protein
MSGESLLFYRKKREEDEIPIQSTPILLSASEEEEVEFKPGYFKYNIQFILLIALSIFPILVLPDK